MLQKFEGKNIKKLLDSENLVLLEFGAPWCGSCKMLEKQISEFALENDDVKVYYIDIDQHPHIAIDMDVSSVPVVMAYEQGHLIGRVNGFTTKRDIAKMFEVGI